MSKNPDPNNIEYMGLVNVAAHAKAWRAAYDADQNEIKAERERLIAAVERAEKALAEAINFFKARTGQ